MKYQLKAGTIKDETEVEQVEDKSELVGVALRQAKKDLERDDIVTAVLEGDTVSVTVTDTGVDCSAESQIRYDIEGIEE